MVMQGDLFEARRLLHDATLEARVSGDLFSRLGAPSFEALAMLMTGDANLARPLCEEGIAAVHDVPIFEYLPWGVLGTALLAMNELDEGVRCLTHADDLIENISPAVGGLYVALIAEAELVAGDVAAASLHADAAVASTTTGAPNWFLGFALAASSRVAAAEGELARSEDVAHEALAVRVSSGDKAGVADTLEQLASLAAIAESHDEAVRLYGAADSLRTLTGFVRFQTVAPAYANSLTLLREAMGDDRFGKTWAEGAALSLEEAVAYVTRGRGERKRPSAGWGSLTPAERDVIALVAEGLSNKEIAQRLFVSPRTVQTHLTHLYGNLAVSSRVQLAKEASIQLA